MSEKKNHPAGQPPAQTLGRSGKAGTREEEGIICTFQAGPQSKGCRSNRARELKAPCKRALSCRVALALGWPQPSPFPSRAQLNQEPW